MAKPASAVLALLLAAPAAAGGLSKYKAWADSPEALFLTSPERARWAKVTTDEEAAKFVAEYLAARGKDFAATIHSRIEAAEKTYTKGKLKGARSPLGQTLVLLGAPSTTERTPGEGERTEFTGGESASPGITANPNPFSGAGGHASSATVVRWIWTGASVPPGVGEKELTVEFEEDPSGNLTFRDPVAAAVVFRKVVEYLAPKPK